MSFFGSSIQPDHINLECGSTLAVTNLRNEPASTSVPRATDHASDSEKEESSSRSKTNQGSSTDAAPAALQTGAKSFSPSPYGSPPITLIVGGPSSRSPQTSQTTFYVHLNLLTSISAFFRAAFDNHNRQAAFLEASTLTMRLPEERAEDVLYLLQWLYSPKCFPAGQSLYHELIDIPLRKMEEYKRERAMMQHAAKHGDISQLISPRPAPPAFGPLMRLYILADRLNLDGGLKGLLCERTKEVGLLASAVPGKEDVWRLWEALPRRVDEAAQARGSTSDAEPRESGSPRRGQEEDLKAVVVEMYANMRGWLVFEEVNENDEGFDWHPLFMKALVVRLLREKADMREATRLKVTKSKCDNDTISGDEKNMAGET